MERTRQVRFHEVMICENMYEVASIEDLLWLRFGGASIQTFPANTCG